MTTFYDANRIPAEPIINVVNRFLACNGERLHDGSSSPYQIGLLAERVDIKPDTFYKILSGWSKTIDFDLADRLLCVMNLNDLWLTELKDVYDNAILAEGEKKFEMVNVSGSKVCERRGCSNRFVPSPRQLKQRFCSNACRATAWKHEKVGLKSNLRGKDRSLEALVCRNGHVRTPKNTGINVRGTRYCLICHRESAQRSRDRRRGLLDA